MALVAYDNSDTSDYEDDDTSTVEIQRINTNCIMTPQHVPDPVQDGHSGNLFTLLPQPSNKKPVVIEEDDEFLHKKETGSNIPKPKAKITVPLLSDFKDIDDCTPSTKPKVINGKNNGLLSMLPQPRHTVLSVKSLIPNVLSQKPANSRKKELLPSQMKKHKVDPKLTLDYSDDSDNDEVQNDFFSINKPVDDPIEDIPLDIEMKPGQINISSQKLPRSIESYFKKESVESVELQAQNETNTEHYEENASSSLSTRYVDSENSNEVVLDEEAILKLCGSRGKRKREEIQIVDVNQQEVLDSAKEMMLKGLMIDTSKRASSKKKGNEPTNQQKRKHQITYLAYQAKANESELQNQWANNRMSKRQTQSKYGF